MSLTHYGVYISWPPTVDLRHEGLGRYLAAFIKGASAHDEVRFVIVCPSWSHESLDDLFKSEAVPDSFFKLVSPKKKPPALRIFYALKNYRSRKSGPSIRERIIRATNKAKGNLIDYTLKNLASAQSIPSLIFLLSPIVFLGIIFAAASPALLAGGLVFLLVHSVLRVFRRITSPAKRKIARIKRMLKDIKGDSLVLRMYQEMERSETSRMLKLANEQTNISAWYCPTAFWPAFNEIKAPKLMCVPDVVLSEFPLGFSKAGGERFLQTFQSVEATINGGDYFVTYSENVKWRTLVDKYGVSAHKISVIHHAPNDLSRWVRVSGFTDLASTSTNYSRSLLAAAFLKSRNRQYAEGFENTSLNFIFYASQLRPNKNVITLLRAYKTLKKKSLISQKLIITGDPAGLPEVGEYISKHNLGRDVLCLHGLSIKELAACYKLADLAVNPSLSEGGCPFTFTEALSVDTPVLMARISVTEEVLTDQQLQEMTFFDPYDWRDLAHRIEWALAHRDELLGVQRKTYAELAKRTWADVVDEHLQVLDRISQSSMQVASQ